MTSAVLDMKPTVEKTDTGIENRARLAGNLNGVLADTYVLLIKTQAYHWNVVGPLFVSIHKLTEEQYEDLFEAVDDLAERVRALGYPAPSSFTEMVSMTVIREDTENASAQDMIGNLTDDHEQVVTRLRDTAELADELRDAVTADLLTKRMEFHEKAIWMLKALTTTA